MNDALSLSKNCLVPEDSWRTMQHFSAVLFPKGGHVLLFFCERNLFCLGSCPCYLLHFVARIFDLRAICCIDVMLKNRWIGTSSKTPSLTRVNQNDLKSFFQRGSGRARAAPWCLLGVSRQLGRCPKSRSSTHVWSLRPLPFSLQHPSGYVTWTKFQVQNGPEVADNLMRMQHRATEHIWNAVLRNMIVSEIRGIFRHPCLDSTQFLGLRETCEFRFSMWMRCQPSWSNLSQLNRFGFRAGQPWLQMFDPTGPEWFVRFRPPLLTLMFLLQFDQYHAWHICGGREMHVVKPCKTVHWPFLYMSKQKRFGNQRHVRVVRVARQPAQGWKAWGKVEGRGGSIKLMASAARVRWTIHHLSRVQRFKVQSWPNHDLFAMFAA